MRNACSPAAASDWSPSPPPFSARSSRPSWSRKERRQIGGHYTSEREHPQSHPLPVPRRPPRRVREHQGRPLHPPHAPAWRSFTPSWPSSASSIPPAAAATSSSSPTANCASWNWKSCWSFTAAARNDARRNQQALQVDVDQFYGIEIERMAGPHRRGRPLADGPPDEPESSPKPSASFYQRLPLKKSPTSIAPTPSAWTGKKSCRPKMQLCPRQSAVRREKFHERRAAPGHGAMFWGEQRNWSA
jgi:hypothetical protein